MSAASTAEFRPIPGFPSHAVSREGVVMRITEPSPSNGGSLNQFREGYTSRSPEVVRLTQDGKSFATTRRVLVQRAFGSSWPAGNRGETNGHRKLMEGDVLEMRELHSRGYGIRELARLFKVTPGNVCAVVQGKSWKHLLPGFEYASQHRHCRA